ncbi:hypothetical protein CRE_28567 [Caenorhabditis remanei]|uniref:Domain of unknown function DX domain-containing protein n=1 Tax=Caenorhabditis remanei TaxID=31234 RepID=E3LN37_CAERE|nr:hypothetical protein CRE_28567 [Caenorhabditis remanei]
MDFLFVIFSLSLLFVNAISEQKDRRCPDKNYPKNACSVLGDCEIGEFCYRDIPMSSNETKNMYGCCKTRCVGTDMPHGWKYEEESQSMISYCSNLTELFYLDKVDIDPNLTKEAYGCCPLPISDFVYGKMSGVLVNRTEALPSGWTLLETGEVTGLKKCCTINDCSSNEYCGRVRNPGNLKLVDETSQNYPKISYEHIGITQRQKDFNLKDLQLCKTNKDCWNKTHFCRHPKEGDVGVCVPIIGNLIQSSGAKEAFLVNKKNGCESVDECDELGIKWFSYQCEKPVSNRSQTGNICVGYEILCSETALFQHGKNFGCQNDHDCARNHSNDDSHFPICVQNPFEKRESACCYEMKSCQYDLDLKPYGVSPLNKQMCSDDRDCQELADDMMTNQVSGKKRVLWGRCMEELENHLGKCCIADVSTLCSVGKSLFPVQKCSNHSKCGWNPFSEERTSWCGDEGYCCEDHEGERSWMCPDGKSIRLEQPKCDSKDGEWCEGRAGSCLMNRCCPMVKPEGKVIRVWAETPWYYSNLSCTDTFDLPDDMGMIYCDPKRKVVTRMTRGDSWFGPIIAIQNMYCSSNKNCTEISDSLVCVREMNNLQRCHTYYDRYTKWYLFIFPTTLLALSSFMFSYFWRHDLKHVIESQTEVIR